MDRQTKNLGTGFKLFCDRKRFFVQECSGGPYVYSGMFDRPLSSLILMSVKKEIESVKFSVMDDHPPQVS